MDEVRSLTVEEAGEVIDVAMSGREVLAAAILEDEAVRVASEKRAQAHCDKIDEEASQIPFWAWAILWFALGILFSISIQNTGMFVYHYLRSQGGGM